MHHVYAYSSRMMHIHVYKQDTETSAYIYATS